MRILVCGGRNYDNYMSVFLVLKELSMESESLYIIDGGASGADEHARNFRIFNEYSGKTFRANWKKHGKVAGPIRNQQMLDEGKPDLVIAFPGGTGTSDMVRRARNAGVEVVEVT